MAYNSHNTYTTTNAPLYNQIHNHPNYNQSQAPPSVFRVTPSIQSTMDTGNTMGNTHTNMNTPASGQPVRSATRNSYISYASTPSWINPSTMIDPSPARPPRPLPDPHALAGVASPPQAHLEGQGYGYGHGGSMARPFNGHAHEGLYITNVTEEEEEEEGFDQASHAEGAGSYRYQQNGYQESGYQQNGYQQNDGYQQNAYPGNTAGYQTNQYLNNGLDMGMPMPIPMERAPDRRPLPVPGAQLRRTATFGSKKGKSFVGGFFMSLKRLPKTVLRKGEKKKPFRDDVVGTEASGTRTNLSGMHTEGTLPQYKSPATAMAGLPMDDKDAMPGAFVSSPPPMDTRRNPSLMFSPPSGEALDRINMDEFPSHEHANPPMEYPPPNLERDRTTMLMYHEQPSDMGSQLQPTQVNEQSPLAGGGLNMDPRSSRSMQDRTPSDQARTATPAAPNPIDTSMPPPGHIQSPVTAHPLPANDYMKMTTSPQAGTQATVTTYTTYSEDPSFTSQLNPVFKFVRALYHLPWMSARTTVDYSPLTGFGGKVGGRGVVKKASKSWYKKKGEGLSTTESNSLDLLSPGETGSMLSPLGGWRRRVRRRNTTESMPMRNRHHGTHHGYHHHHHHRHNNGSGRPHGHGLPRRHRYHRRSTSTITFEEYRHQRNVSPLIPPMYPYPFPPYPYPLQTFPASAPAPAPGASPAQADTSTTANQGTPGPGQEQKPERAQEGSAQAQGEGGPRGPRGGGWGVNMRAAVFPGGYAAYQPSPPPFYYTQSPMLVAPGYASPAGGGGGNGSDREQGPSRRAGAAGVVYMPVVPGAFQYE